MIPVEEFPTDESGGIQDSESETDPETPFDCDSGAE
jgi:hypothetical protein